MLDWTVLLAVILKVSGQAVYPEDFPCANGNWLYRPESGECYSLVSAALRYPWADAEAECRKMLPSYPDVKVRVVETRDGSQADALKFFLGARAIKEKVWLGASRTRASDPFTWATDGSSANFDFLSWSGGAGAGNCMVFFFTNQRVQKQWVTVSVVENVFCADEFALVCAHTVKNCEVPPGGFDPAKMIFIPTPPHVGTVRSIVCAPGYFPKTSTKPNITTGANVDPSLSAGQYRCEGKRFSTAESDPSNYISNFVYSGYALPDCVDIDCDLDPKSLCQLVEGTIRPADKVSFKHGENATFKCSEGFAYFYDLRSSTASIQCRAVPDDPRGVWLPGTCQACVAIRCDEAEMAAMVPKFGSLVSARSKLTEEVYGSHQINQFNQYGNIVKYMCDPAYFFNDRSFEKHIECALKDGSANTGEWRGYSGTAMPIPSECEPVTCMYESILIKPQYNINADFTISFSNGSVITANKLQPISYPYMTVVHYTCLEKYETVTKAPGQNISCGSVGRWKPQLMGCIKTSQNLSTGSTGRYVPPALEAPSAGQIGAVVIAIIVIFLVALLLLDLPTLRTDILWFINNLRLQRRLWLAKRRLKKAKRTITEKEQ